MVCRLVNIQDLEYTYLESEMSMMGIWIVLGICFIVFLYSMYEFYRGMKIELFKTKKKR